MSMLLATGKEGILCCFMAAPLLAVGMALGALAGYYLLGRTLDRLNTPGKMLLLLISYPLLLGSADHAERSLLSGETVETFTTEIVIDASPERVWDALATMQELKGPRPFLLYIGLPVPASCQLESPAVGAVRHCYFANGEISQELMQWQRPQRMEFKITGNTLPGRHWLTFRDAGYELTSEEGKTRVKRYTTIATGLYPRFYWRPLERWGVTSEHDYVLANVQRLALKDAAR